MNTPAQGANYSEITASLARLKDINDKIRALQAERVSVMSKLQFCHQSLGAELDIHCVDIPVVFVPQNTSDVPKLGNV